MFRWVALSLETLKEKKHPRDFEKALDRLPTELSKLYNIIYKQIDTTDTHKRNVTIMTLKWLLCAQRLLSIRELIAAVSVDSKSETESSSDSDIDSTSEQIISTDDDSESEHYSLSEFDIIQFCRNLVIIDPDLGIFRFAHQSVREYLESHKDYFSFQHSYACLKKMSIRKHSPIGSDAKNGVHHRAE
jgi:ankyrin repeat domain-containing protein 50